MQCATRTYSPQLDRESLREPLLSVPLADFSKIPGQVFINLTVSRLYGQASPFVPTRDFSEKTGTGKGKITINTAIC